MQARRTPVLDLRPSIPSLDSEPAARVELTK